MGLLTIKGKSPNECEIHETVQQNIPCYDL